MNHHVTQGVRASAGCRTGLRPAGSTAVQATRGHSWIPGPPAKGVSKLTCDLSAR